jgi:hypothetical protein
VRYFFDRSISVRIPKAIRVLEGQRSAIEVVYKDERFPIDTADVDWIKVLASQRDWVIVNLDPEILRKPAERAAWREAQLTGFFLDGSWGNLKLDDFAWRFFRWWPVIKLQSTLVASGATFIVPTEGTALRQMP